MEKRMVPVAKKTLWRDFMGKGKWKPILLMAGAVLGIALLLYGGSGEKKKEKEAKGDSDALIAYRESVEKKIDALCSRVNGVSDVSVAISLESGFEYVYAQNEAKGDYVVIGSGSSESAVRVTEIPPRIAGVGIVCKGGGNPVIQRELIRLISAAYGINSSRIYITGAK